MGFDTFIGRCYLGDMSDPYMVLDGFLLEYFPDIDMDKIEYVYHDNKYTWHIDALNEYTKKVFYMDLKMLQREQKIKNLLNG